MALNWWKNDVIYHVYLSSFKDGNGDGIGDFKGLASKLDYFKYLNIHSLLLSPIHPSPMKDNGYDISDYKEIHPIYGTMEDFDNFMKELKKRGLNVILDMVANHTSDEHEWFLKSVEREEPYTDYYMWADPIYDGDKILPPNNWISIFDGPAWKYNEKRKQFYLHQFLCEQPDLNWRNPNVRKEFEDIIRFWLAKGVDGFRVDAFSFFFEDELMRDEPVVPRTKCKPGEHGYLAHIYTEGHPENVALIKEWRERVFDEFEKKTGKQKIILTEAYESIEKIRAHYGDANQRISDVPLNFELLMNIKETSSARDLHRLITSWIDSMPEGKVANWTLGNHDRPRMASRVGREMVRGLHMVVALLPGLLFCYYGEELGMEDGPIKPSEIKDTFALQSGKDENSRDPCRTPMQWDDSELTGFTENAKPWLPINKNYKKLNVKNEKNDPFSILEQYRLLVKLKTEPAIANGTLEFPYIDGNVFTMIRSLPNAKSFLVVLNMGNSLTVVDLSNTSKQLPETGRLELTNNHKYNDKSSNIYVSANTSPQYLRAFDLCNTEGKANIFHFNNLILLPKEAMIISFTPKK